MSETHLVPLFRLTSGYANRLLTTTCSERKLAMADNGYKDEGVLGYLSSVYVSGTQRVYRFVYSDLQHFYTTNPIEGVRVAGYRIEDFDAYIFESPAGGKIPVFRLYKRLGEGDDHLYTISRKEADAALKEGYREEGILGYLIDKHDNPC